jgi:osmotically-inducible protein OsmY
MRAWILMSLACAAAPAAAQNAAEPAMDRLEPIVVTAKRRADPAADEKTKRQVEEALHADAFFYDEHVTVTIKNGVVTMRGIVFDDWDVRTAVRIARKISGVKRVATDFYVPDGT